jgi:hypothetical protein
MDDEARRATDAAPQVIRHRAADSPRREMQRHIAHRADFAPCDAGVS